MSNGESPGAFYEGFLDDYFAECEEHLSGARATLLALERALATPVERRPLVDELFRLFHSLKGISGMVELRAAEQLAHELESCLRAVRRDEIAFDETGLDVLIAGTDRLEQVIEARRANRPLPPIDDLIARVSQLLAAPRLPAPARGTVGAAPAAAPVPKWRCVFQPSTALLSRGVGVDAIRQRLAALGDIVSAVPRVGADASIAFEFIVAGPSGIEAFAPLLDDGLAVTPATAEEAARPDAAAPADDAARFGAPQQAAASTTPSHVVRVDLARLDELMRRVSDLVISRARLGESLARVESRVPAVEWRTVQENVGAIDRQLRLLRDGIMRVRLVPVGEIFRRMPFVVRDLARESGKRVRLDLIGQTTEIDKFLIERMMDPVLHLVRNAVSHGIETPEERIAAGKPPDGTVTLTASTAGEIVTLEIADDGRGIDGDAIVARARAAGLPVIGDAADPASLLAVLCAPGFSTREDSDRASGRGMGMAVVNATVEELSGTIGLETQPGAGTRFTIQLPVTLTIADALLARVGRETFAVPQTAVREVMEVAAADVRSVEQNELVPFRTGAIPLLRVARLFDLQAQPPDRLHLLIVATGAGVVGLAVDRVVGQREIVVRSITDPLVRVDGIAGATDLGDGRVVLILDPAALARLARAGAGRGPVSAFA